MNYLRVSRDRLKITTRPYVRVGMGLKPFLRILSSYTFYPLHLSSFYRLHLYMPLPSTCSYVRVRRGLKPFLCNLSSYTFAPFKMGALFFLHVKKTFYGLSLAMSRLRPRREGRLERLIV